MVGDGDGTRHRGRRGWEGAEISQGLSPAVLLSCCVTPESLLKRSGLRFPNLPEEEKSG